MPTEIRFVCLVLEAEALYMLSIYYYFLGLT
jgi:hypothetical protein